MLKKLARKILESEIHYERRSRELAAERAEEAERDCKEATDKYHSLLKETDRIKDENEKLKEKIKELESQNAILRHYYNLDEEPSQELKDKMYLDDKYREMDKELTKLRITAEFYMQQAASYKPVYVPIMQYSYFPSYTPLLSWTCP